MASNKCAERNPCGEKGMEKKFSDSERLDILEKEVYFLRHDLDRIKWEQAIAEAAIGRAIIRGSVSLGNNAGLFPGMTGAQEPSTKHRQIIHEEVKKNPCQNNQLVQLAERNQHAGNDGKSKQNNKEECGYFTLG